jgi:AraC-like DNA-binding protein
MPCFCNSASSQETAWKSSIAKFHPGVAKARGLLNARYAERVTLDDLASAAGLSKFHLVRSFTQECGLAPHAY